MCKKLILLNSLLTILSIVPARAQYSFAKIYGGSGDDRPYGIFQLSNGNYILYGYYDSGPGPGINYISCLDKFGNLLWEKQGTNPYGATSHDCFETANQEIYVTGQSDIGDGSPTITKLKANGTIVFDTTLRLNTQAGESGFIFRSLHSDEKKEIISIGFAGKFQVGYILFHKANYSGQQLMYKLISFPDNYFQMKHFFKVKGKEEYLIFGQRMVIRLDSIGNQIDSVRSTVEYSPTGNETVLDIVQNDNGTFTALLEISGSAKGGYHLQQYNDTGIFEKYIGRLAKRDTVYVNTLTATNDHGWFIAGTHFFRVDSAGQLLWSKSSNLPENGTMVNVRQALDGGFYGCALDFEESSDYNMYVFKTTPEGDIHTGLLSVNKQSLKAQVMPNPSQGIFTIAGEFKQAQVSITNLLGQALLKEQMITTGGTVDASGLQAGMYVLTVNSGNGSYVQKVNIIK